jgi:hypothetical protein
MKYSGSPSRVAWKYRCSRVLLRTFLSFSKGISTLELMLEGELLQKVYSNRLMEAGYSQMTRYLETLAFKNPHMKILGVGADTGSAALSALNTVCHNESNQLTCFHYTDISPQLLDRSTSKFTKWKAYMDFKTLDITKDPELQGFESNS